MKRSPEEHWQIASSNNTCLGCFHGLVGKRPVSKKLTPTAKDPREQKHSLSDPATDVILNQSQHVSPKETSAHAPEDICQMVLITPQTEGSLPASGWGSICAAGEKYFDWTAIVTYFRDKPRVGKGRDQGGLRRNK